MRRLPHQGRIHCGMRCSSIQRHRLLQERNRRALLPELHEDVSFLRFGVANQCLR